MVIGNHKVTSVAIGLVLILALEMQGLTPARASSDGFQTGTVYRVSTMGTISDPCGMDWANPCNLQYALTTATSGDEIWVAAGIYYPDEGYGQVNDDRNSTFQLKNGVAVYGGFSGTEALLTQRNSEPSTNSTILSGDIGAQGIYADNTYHVVEANYLAVSPILDGFTITGGNANGPLNNFGGGLFNNESNTILENIIFTGNSTNGGGGGMFAISQGTLRATYFAPILTNVIFAGNSANRGGGMFTQNSSPQLTNVIFSGNAATAGTGGGMANLTLHPETDEYSTPVLTNVTFSGNTANGGGGGMYNSNSNPVLTNVTFSGNTATIQGGAILNEGASLTLKNVTIGDDMAPVGYGGAIRNVTIASIPSNLTIENSILWGDSSEEFSGDGTGNITIVDSVIQGGCPTGAVCTNVITTDPVLSELANNGGFTQTRALGKGSSAINTGGVNSTCTSDDQRGALRPNGDGCDIGAFEAYLLIVTAESKTINYGDPEPTFSFQYSGLTDGDTDSVIDSSPTCGVSGAHTNAGVYTITCSGGMDDKYLFFAYVDSTLTINKVTPTLSVTNSPLTYNGLPRGAAVTASVAGKVSNILIDGSATQINAGTYPVTANFTTTDTVNYNSLIGASAGNFVINKVTPVLSVTNSPVLYDDLPHEPVVSSSVAGTISNILVGGFASQTNAGTYPVTANFTPTDTVNYNSLVNTSAGNFIIRTDITSPSTQIVSHPLSPSDRDVMFTFSSDDETATFECQMDGNGFSVCISPKSYTGLDDGSHTFMVRAMDPFDNVDPTPAAHTWIVTGHQTYYMMSKVVTPFSITTQNGSADGLVGRLWYLEQSGVENNTNAYVNMQTSTGVYFGYQSFYIPDDIQTTFISNALLQVNFNGQDASVQTWTWSVYDWSSNLWIKLGSSVGSTANEWNGMIFPLRNIRRFISPNREIRIQLRSSNVNSDLKVDYEAIHLTYRAVTVTPRLPAPPVPANRPGIASVRQRMVR